MTASDILELRYAYCQTFTLDAGSDENSVDPDGCVVHYNASDGNRETLRALLKELMIVRKRNLEADPERYNRPDVGSRP